MTRLLRAFTFAAALLALLTIVACADDEGAEEEGEGTPAAQVTPLPTRAGVGAVEMGIDPETTGNTATALGDLEPCVRVDVPSPSFDDVSDYNIDVYIKGDTQAPMAYDAALNYNPSIVHVAAPGTDPLIKVPGAASLGDPLPDSDGMFAAGVVSLSGNPGTAGDGVLLRLGLDIGASGLVTFTLLPSPRTAYASVGGIHNLTLASAQLAINEDCPQ